MKLNKDLTITILLSFILIILYRSILPYGDEPDFHIRLHGLLYDIGRTPLKFLYEVFDNNIVYKSNCNVKSSITSLSGSITGIDCFLSVKDYFIRIFNHFLIVFFLFFIVFIYDQEKHISFKNKSVSSLLLRDSILISSIFPGFLYFTGLASVESLVLLLSIVIILYINNIILLTILVTIIFFIDAGNTVVVLLFLFIYAGLIFLSSRIKKVWLLILISCSIIVLMSFGLEVILLLSGLPAPIGNKVQAIYNVLTIGSQSDLISKYPSIYRPLYTATTLVLSTPKYLFSVFALILVAVAVFLLMIKWKKFFNTFNNNNIFALFFSAISTVIVVTSILPTYAYGKYYAFLIPVLIMPFVSVFGFYRTFLYCLLISVVTIINFIFFWI